MAFPTIAAPKSIKRTPVDNTLRSPTDAGYVQARPRTTRKIYDFEVSLLLSTAHRILLEDYYDLVGGATIFSWYCTKYNTTYQVRFTKPVSSSVNPEQKNYYDVSFAVQSV